MRHRSPRPILDRLVPDVTPGMARRGLLLFGAVVAAVALGVAVAGPLADPGPVDRTMAVKSPLSSASASWSIGTPPAEREPRPTRSGERSSPPAAPVEQEPAPTTVQQPSRSVEDTTTRSASPSSSPSATRTSSPTDEGSASPSDGTAPETSSTTTTVEDGVWTVTSTADEAGTFECSLDGGDYEECDPTESFEDLDNGQHTLVVRAVDESGNVDPSPTELVTNVTGGLSD